MVVEKKIDYGRIDFGIHEGLYWNDLPRDYLEYLISDKCHTQLINKVTARKVLLQYNLIENQVPLFKVGGRQYVK